MYIPTSEQAADAVRLVTRQAYYPYQRRRYLHPGAIFGIVAAGLAVVLVLLCCLVSRRRRRRAVAAGGTAPAYKWGGGWNANGNTNANKPNVAQQNGGGSYNPYSTEPPPYVPPQQQAGGPKPMAPAYTATHHGGQGHNANYYSSTTPAPEVTGLHNQNNGRW